MGNKQQQQQNSSFENKTDFDCENQIYQWNELKTDVPRLCAYL